MKRQLVEMPISTPDGQFIARYSDQGLAGLDFPNARGRRRGDGSQTSSPAGMANDSSRRLLQVRKWHRATAAALKNILTGRQPEEFPPFDAAGTDFQKAVWRALRKIPSGRTKSYGEIAEAIGTPKAVRAVGGACGANPIPVLVPCHRVLAAGGKIGGFGGGLDWKRKLLDREGIGHIR